MKMKGSMTGRTRDREHAPLMEGGGAETEAMAVFERFGAWWRGGVDRVVDKWVKGRG